MEDVVEFGTHVGLNSFIRLTASGTSFQVLGNHNCKLSFKESPTSNSYIFQVLLGQLNSIRLPAIDFIDSPRAPNVLDEGWNKLWVTWNRGRVCLGRMGDITPILQTDGQNLEKVKFIQLSQDYPITTLYWRFELGPVHPENKCYSVEGGKPEWVTAEEGARPLGAVIGGHEDEPLYVIRAKHAGSLAPGKYVPSQGAAYVAWGGEAREKEDFEFLIGYNFDWVPAKDGFVPQGALMGGFSEHNLFPLYIGRAEYEGHLIIGKVQPTHKVIYIPYKGKEIAREEYEVLVTKFDNDPRVINCPQLNRNSAGSMTRWSP